MTQKTNQNPWTMDVRVRERNLKSGALTDKDVEKYLGGLPDVGDQADSFATASQPALAQPVQAPVVMDDEEEDEEDDVDDEPEGSSDDLNGEGTP
jgi:hypothetical protein